MSKPHNLQSLKQILMAETGISEDIFQNAGASHSESLHERLLQQQALTETDLLTVYSRLYQIPVWPELPINGQSLPEVSQRIRQIPIQYLKKHVMTPFWIDHDASDADRANPDGASGAFKKTGVAINDPASFQALDDLIRMLDAGSVTIVFSTRSAIGSAINRLYDADRYSAEQLVLSMDADTDSLFQTIEPSSDLLDDVSDAPIIRLVNGVISQSIRARASDIHIEPYPNSLKIRYRIDGLLYDLTTPPKWIQPSLISRIKIMAKMNIAEKRLPQDGRMDVRIGDQQIDIRVSTIPTSFGERIVLRLLNKTSSLLHLNELGLSADHMVRLNTLIESPYGIFLVTGPTGSGKTTTLYAILSSMIRPSINIITIEDPVEYQINGISQIQVNPKIDLTFARGLRSIVRQDPDVILVGEIRDRETADIAVQSALTGHLVFSTLHTNDSAGAITRLVDIGIEPFLISSSVIGVAAQRLIRILCDTCKTPYQPDDAILEQLNLTADQLQGPLYRAAGCPSCFHTGYRGRMGIFEIMLMDDRLKNLILKTYDANHIRQEALRSRMTTLREDGLRKVIEGKTSLEEVYRVTHR
ncbi:MAG: type II secretion system ATPase GspE [Desulfatirhabdiaceae bacterium]